MTVTSAGTPTSGGTANSVTDTTMTTAVVSSTVGDINIVAISIANGTATVPTVTPPAGWSIWPGQAFVTDGASPQLGGSAYFRVVQAGDTITPVFTFSGPANGVWGMLGYTSTTGFDPTTPIVASQSAYAGTTTAKTTDTLTTSTTGRLVFGFGDRSGGPYSAVAGPGTPTQLVSSAHASTSTVYLFDSAGDIAAGSQQYSATGPNTSVGWSFIGELQAAAATGVSGAVAGAATAGATATGARSDSKPVTGAATAASTVTGARADSGTLTGSATAGAVATGARADTGALVGPVTAGATVTAGRADSAALAGAAAAGASITGSVGNTSVGTVTGTATVGAVTTGARADSKPVAGTVTAGSVITATLFAPSVYGVASVLPATSPRAQLVGALAPASAIIGGGTPRASVLPPTNPRGA